jgi:hypothetical protein
MIDGIVLFGTFSTGSSGGGVANHSGSIEQATTCWYKTFSLFGQTSITGKKIRGLIYCKRTWVLDGSRSLSLYDYATKKELFNLKLRGNA